MIVDFILVGKAIGATIGAILGAAILVAAGLYVHLKHKRGRLTKALSKSNLIENHK